MAGVATAFHLAVRLGIYGVLLVDERDPLTLTSDKGTEAYRNWWPGPDDTMVRFMQRSITLLELLSLESGHAFAMNRQGYAYLTGEPDRIPLMRREAETVSGFGAGLLRIHSTGGSGYDASASSLDGADLVLDPSVIAEHLPFVTHRTVAMLHARRCGWMDARALGHWMLDRFLEVGGRFVRDCVNAIDIRNDRLDRVVFASGTVLYPGTLVFSTGPLFHETGLLMGLKLPVSHELHCKIILPDPDRIIPADIPMLIWTDPVFLSWTEEEKRRLSGHEDTRWLTDKFPAGVHLRPRHRDGRDTILGVWTYDRNPCSPVWPLPINPHYAETVIRALTVMVPRLSAYFGKGGETFVDGGYYCKTKDNRPLIGPLPVQNIYVNAALSGYGVMAAQAAAELVAGYLTGEPLPAYAPAFRFERFQDPVYLASLTARDGMEGQL